MADHDRLMAYLVTISRALYKEVLVTAENSQAAVYIRVNGADIQFMLGLTHSTRQVLG